MKVEVDSVKFTMSFQEAKLLHNYVAKTNKSHVEEVFDYSKDDIYIAEVNEVLFNLYCTLTDILEEPQ